MTATINRLNHNQTAANDTTLLSQWNPLSVTHLIHTTAHWVTLMLCLTSVAPASIPIVGEWSFPPRRVLVAFKSLIITNKISLAAHKQVDSFDPTQSVLLSLRVGQPQVRVRCAFVGVNHQKTSRRIFGVRGM